MRFRHLQHASSGFLLILCCACLALAQATNGSIHGTVKDQTGAVLPRATVTVKHVETNAERKEVTTEEGTYIADNLQPGEYEVTVEAPHFQKQLQRITVLTSSNVEADFSMTVGASSETVVVTSEAGQLNTSDYKVDGVITRERIENLPLNGRSFLSLAALEPGVDVTYSANPGTFPNNYFRVSIAGSTQSLTRISVDGANVNDRVTGGTSQNFSQETVQEFQISTFNFDLSVGNTSSGAVNIVSRTGTNQFHGSGFYFFRDHNIAAFPALKRPDDPSAFNPGFNNPDLRQRLVDPFFVRRNTGVNLGGPVKKDKLFFFSNFEYTNQVGAQTLNFTNPLFAGFSHVGQLPFRGKLFNTRLDYKLNNKHTAYLRYSQDVNTNLSSSSNLESTWTSSRNYAYQVNLGVTSVLTPRLVNEFRDSFSYFSNQLRPPDASECSNLLYCFDLNGPRIGGFGLTIGNDNNVTQHRILRTYQLNENIYWQKSAHRIRFGGNWEHYYGHGSWARIYQGSFNLYDPATLGNLPDKTLYNNLPATLRTTTAGLPTLADILKLPVNGNINVSVGDAKQPPAYHAHDQARNNAYRLYIQDTWQVRPKFNFSYGLAWSFDDNLVSHDLDKPEYLRPVLGGANADLRPTRQDYNNFQPSIGFAWTLGKQNKTVIRGGTGIYNASPNSFYTRLGERGFLGPAGNGLVPLDSSLVPNPFAGQTIPGTGVPAQPATLRFTQPTTFSGQDAASLIASIRSQLASRWGTGQDISIRGIEVTKQAVGASGEGIFMSDLTTGYTFHVTAGVQREIARNLILTADFVMRRGVHFGGTEAGFGVDVNHFTRPKVTAVNPTTGVVTFTQDPVIPVCTTAQLATPKFPCSSSVILAYWSGISTRYTGLLMKLNKRFSNGWQFTASYALSRYWLNTNSNVNAVSIDHLYETAGIGGGDVPHRFTFSGFYELPAYKGESRLLRGLLNSWQVGLISDMRSAPPLNPNIGIDLDGDGISRFTLPGIPWNGFGRGYSADDIRKAVDQYNATYPTPDVNATNKKRTPQNQVIPIIKLPDNFSSGDPFFSQDVRLTRLVRIGEKVKMSLIVESFNVFNIANLTSYGSGLNALVAAGQVQQATFGQPGDRVNQIFGTGGPRAFQFAARISF